MRHSVDLRKACCALRKLEPMAAPAAGAQRLGHRPAPRTVGDAPRRPLLRADGRRPREVLPARRLERGRRLALRAGGTTCPTTTCTTSFPSIGCAPCTRAVSAGEDFRARALVVGAGGGQGMRPAQPARGGLGLRQEPTWDRSSSSAPARARRPHHPARGAAPGHGRRGAVRRPDRPGPARAAPQARWVDVGKRGFGRAPARPRSTPCSSSWHSSMRWWCGSRAATPACSAAWRKNSRRCRPRHRLRGGARRHRRARRRRRHPASADTARPGPQREPVDRDDVRRRFAGRPHADTEVFYMAGRQLPRSAAGCATPAGRPTRRSAWSRAPAGPTSCASDHSLADLARRPCCTPVGRPW
jgi:hypothetical protein